MKLLDFKNKTKKTSKCRKIETYTVYYIKFSCNFALLDLFSSRILRTHVNPIARYSGTDVGSGFHERASARLSEVCPPER